MQILNKILFFFIVFLSIEILTTPIFYIIRKKFEKNHSHTLPSALKGILERFIIFLGLASSIPAIITFFGALKLGTRLREHQDSKISNDYFLIGNLISMTIALLEYLLFKTIYEQN